MIQLFVIFSFLAWIIALLGLGYLASFSFQKFTGFKPEIEIKFLYYGIWGFILIFFFGTVINFFLPLGTFTSLLFLTAGFILFIIFKKNILIKFDWFNILTIGGLLIFSGLYALVNLKVYDTGLYHLPMINWINKMYRI